MERRDIKRVGMIDGVITYCDGNTTATSGITNFALRLQDVKDKRVLIDGMNQLGSVSTTGITTDVGVLRSLMISKAFKCASATLALANSTNNNTLKALVNFTKPKLNKLASEDVDDVCQQIHDATAANVAGATPFGIVASDVTDLQAAIDLYRASTGDTRDAIVSKSQANKQAHIMIRELIDELLVGQMDKMVNTIEETENMFWRGYFQVRELINPASFSTVLKLLVINGGTNEPLKGAKCYRDAGPTFKRSTKLGFVTYKDIEDGNHTFLLKHKLFNDLAVPAIPMNYGNKKTVTVVMTPVGSTSIQMISKEGGVTAGSIIVLDTLDINPTPATIVTVEVTENPMVISASDNTDPVMGPVTWTLPIGTYIKTIAEFAVLIGATDDANIVKLQSPGPNNTHYKITFTNLEG